MTLYYFTVMFNGVLVSDILLKSSLKIIDQWNNLPENVLANTFSGKLFFATHDFSKKLPSLNISLCLFDLYYLLLFMSQEIEMVNQ